MRILLDDHECALKVKSVGDAVAAAADLAEQRGRRVVDVSVDGEPWGEKELANPDWLNRAAAEVRMVTVHPGELLRDTFLSAAKALEDAEALQRDAAKLLQADDGAKGMAALTDALSMWLDIHKATVQGLSFGHIDPSELQTSEGSFTDAASELGDRLRALRDAMTSGDTVAVCDTLLYEFPGTSKRWSSILAELARRADVMIEDG